MNLLPGHFFSSSFHAACFHDNSMAQLQLVFFGKIE